MWLVSVTRSQVWMGSRCVKFGVIALTLSYWSLEVQHGTSWQRSLWESEKKIVTLHKDGEGYKKIAKTLKLPGGSVMVWGRMSATGTGEQQFIEGTMIDNMYCDILKQSMIPSLRRLGRRAVFQHDNDPKHTSKMTTVLLKKLRVKVMDWPKHLSRPKPYWASVGHPQTEGGGAQGL